VACKKKLREFKPWLERPNDTLKQKRSVVDETEVKLNAEIKATIIVTRVIVGIISE